MPHKEVLYSYIKRTCIKKGKDYDNFIFLALILQRYANMINNLYAKLRGLEKLNKELTSEIDKLKQEITDCDGIINSLEESNSLLMDKLIEK